MVMGIGQDAATQRRDRGGGYLEGGMLAVVFTWYIKVMSHETRQKGKLTV